MSEEKGIGGNRTQRPSEEPEELQTTDKGQG